MIREIKTTLAIDGEKEFKAALTEAEREMRVMNAELREMSAEFKATDDAQRYYTQRSETLNSKVKQQEEIVEALTKAVKDSADVYGTAARQTDDYRIRLSNATAKLFDMRREAEQANRDLEELGRDSNKIGRQIERGIGDAAEDTADKLDGMFAKVAQDVNALKSSVAFQTTMNVGGFVVDAVQGVMGFVDENQELNRKMSQARTVIEMYGYNWDKVYEIIRHATGVVGDQDAAREAIVNLSAAGFDSEEQIGAIVENLLGVYTSSGGALNFGSLAEDYLESVKEKTPTGTFAEAIIKFTDRSVEDVQKVLENAKSHADTLEIATGILTEAGLQNKSKNWVKENKELYDAETAKFNLTTAWADLALELQPVVTDLTSALTTAVTNVTDWVDWAKDFASKYGDTVSSLIDVMLEKIIPGYNAITGVIEGVGSIFSGKAQRNYDLFNQAYEEYYGKKSPLQTFFEWLTPSANGKAPSTADAEDKSLADYLQKSIELNKDPVNAAIDELRQTIADAQVSIDDAKGTINDAIDEYYTNPQNESSFGRWWTDFWGITPQKYTNGTEEKEPQKGFFEWLFPSAGAETLPTADLQEYGSAAWQEMSKGMLTASESNPAVDAAVKTAMAELKAQDVIDEAKLAGKNLMIEFGNGIATGAEIPISNVRNMVDTINAELARIATPAFGLGWSGMTGGNIYLYNQKKSLANTMSKTIGAGVRSTMHKK